MKKLQLVIYLLLITLGIRAQVANDDCITAQAIVIPASGSVCVTGTTTNALGTTFTSSPCWPINQNIPEVWYTFVANGAQNTVTVSPFGPTPAQQVGVTLTNSPCGSGTLSTCAISSTAGGQATANYVYAPGTQVWVNVGSMIATGGFQICITSVTPPPAAGGSCPTAAVLCDKSTFTLNTFPGNVASLQPSCFGNTFQDPVFYQFTVGQAGTCEWTANPAGSATELDWVMYDITTGCPNNSTPELACNFFYAGSSGADAGMSSTLATAACPITNGLGPITYEYCAPANLVLGHTYLMIIDNYSNISGETQGFTLSWGGTFQIAPTSQFTVNTPTGCGSVTTGFTNNSIAAVSQTWNFGNGNTSTAVAAPTQTYSSPGQYLVSLSTTSATGCTDVSSQTVIVNAIPTFTPPVNATYCKGVTVPTATLTSTPVGATFSWTNSNTAIGLAASGTGNIPSFTAANTTGAPITSVITITPTLNGCVGTAQSYTITINPSPTVTVNSPSMCSGSVTLNASGATSYTWAAGTTPLNANGDSASVSPASTTTYVVTGTTSGCTGTATATVTVVNAVTAPTTAPVTYCQNATATALTATASAGGTLNWYGTNATGGTASASAPTPSTATAGTFTYYVSQTIGGCEGPRAPLVVTINAIPNPPAAPNVVYCQSQAAAQLSATASAGGTLNWYGTNATGGTASATAPTPSTATAGTVTYYVSQTISGCESNRTPIIVTVNGTPGAPVTTNVTYCQNATAVSLSTNATASAGGTLNWYGTNATGGTASATAPTPSTATVGTTSYYVSQSILSCEGPRAQIDVTITAIPANPTTAPITYCQNAAAAILTATASAGGTLNWYGTNATGGTASATAPTPTTTGPGTTTYYVSQTISGCESPREPLIVTVNATPNAPATSPLVYCQNATAASLTAITSAGATLNWYGTNATGGTASATAPTPLTTSAGTTTYYVSQTSNGCESPRSPLVVTVNQLPSAPGTTPVTYCVGNTPAILNATLTNGATANWYGTNATGGIATATPPSVSTGTAAVTTYYVSQTLVGCEGPRVPLVVTVNPLPTATLNTIAPGCAPVCRDFYLSSSSNLVSYYWNMGNGVLTGNDTILNHCYSNSGSYGISVFVTDNNNCSDTIHFPSVSVYEVPVAEFTYGPRTVTILEPDVNFTNESLGSNIISYSWQFGDANNSASGLINPTFTYSNVGYYYVTLTVINSNACIDSVTHPIYIPEDWAIYVPNAFSPNGDGINDMFHPDGIGLDEKTYQLWIFDRWGNQIFYTKDWNTYWDGKVSGHSNLVQEDVYIWKILVRSFKGDKYSKFGHVTVVR